VDEKGRVVSYYDQERDRLEYEGIDYLSSVESRLEKIPVERVVRFGDPTEEILLEAGAFDADLIAMTTAGRSGLTRTLFGSVAEQVFRRAERPVLLYSVKRKE
jgi:nucleotide-binding universal stress UspA family protein